MKKTEEKKVVDKPRRKSPGRPKNSPTDRSGARSPRKQSPARKAAASPKRKAAASPKRKASPSRNASPSRKASPSRRVSPVRRASPSRSRSAKIDQDRSPDEKSLFDRLNDKVLRVVMEDELRKSAERANSARRSEERANSAIKNLSESLSSLGNFTKTNVSSVSNITMRKSTRLLTLRETEKLKEATPESEREPRTRDREHTPMGPIKATVLENIHEKEPSSRKLREFGGWLGALFWLLFTPSATIAIHIYARHLRGGPPFEKAVKNWKTFLQPEIAALGLGFVVLQAVLALLPLGPMVDGQPNKQGRLRYRCNGFVNCLLSVAAVGGLYYLKYPVTRVLDKTVPLFVTGQIFGFLLSIALFWKGGRASVATLNPHAISGIRIYDFFMGREINPQIGPWDVKTTLLKSAIIATVVLNVLVVVKSLEGGRTLSPTLMLAVGLQLFYYLDYLLFEKTLLTSFEVMYEGTGAMAVLGYATLPFFSTIITMYIQDERVELSPYILAVLFVLHTIGYVIYRASNNQKNEYRRNPLNPALNHLETISTSRGRKLLASGWWGWVRHPNYSGDMLMAWTWGACCGSSHWLPYIVPVTVTLFMIHRLLRNEARCHRRYDSAWEFYCRRVPARLIPKVF